MKMREDLTSRIYSYIIKRKRRNSRKRQRKRQRRKERYRMMNLVLTSGIDLI